MEVQMNRPIRQRPNVGPAERGISLAAGLAMISYLLTRRPDPQVGIPLGLEAGYMLYRGASGNCMFYRMLEINRAEHGIYAKRSVTIGLPRQQLYRIWRNFENLPRFMNHLQRVDVDEASGGKLSHWVSRAPLGREVQWKAEITAERENEYISWHSLPGSTVKSIGNVLFEDAPGERGTIVTVEMQYNPPAGSLGAAFAKLFGEEPGQQLRDDLRHFKQMMETGEVPSVEGQPSGRNQEFDRSIAERQRKEDLVEEASVESFPASDPPAWISGKKNRRRVTS